MADERIALLIAYGPEARAFLQSGLAGRLARRNEVVVLTSRPHSAAFQDVEIPVLQAPPLTEGATLRTVRAWSRGARRRLPALAAVATAAERCAGRVCGAGEWSRFLRQNRIGMLITASAFGAKVLPALQAAVNVGIPSVVLLNSWRDRSVRPDFPVHVSALGFVAGERLPSNGYGAPRLTRVAGSLHQAAVRRAPAMDRRVFCAALGLDPSRPIALYTTAANDIDEPARVQELAKRLRGMNPAPQLLVRTNPMDDAPGRFAEAALHRPLWEWVREDEWNCPLPEDLPWWRACLEHSDIAVSLPSTVALDCAAWGKPAVVLAFGRGAALWLARGYDIVRRNAQVYPAESFDAAAVCIGRLAGAQVPRGVEPPDAVAAASELVEAALQHKPRALRPRWGIGEATR